MRGSGRESRSMLLGYSLERGGASACLKDTGGVRPSPLTPPPRPPPHVARGGGGDRHMWTTTHLEAFPGPLASSRRRAPRRSKPVFPLTALPRGPVTYRLVLMSHSSPQKTPVIPEFETPPSYISQ